jgi:signal transduction histidine kinase/AmiR/NasT family two-component response regulator
VTNYTHNIITRRLLKQNYRELLLVFATFTLMALVGYFSIGNILRGRLYDRAEEIILTAGANVRVGLSEAEAALINSYYIVQGMMEAKASKQEILDYLTATTEWMRRREQGLLRYYGIFGYINGEYYDGVGMNPNDDFIPQTRLWYQTAIRSGSSVGYTTPYTDWHTGDTIFSAVRNIDLKNGDLAGILAVDFSIDWLVEYAGSLSPAPGGYGMLLSQNMTLMAHPDSTLIGSQLQDLGGSYEEIALTLRGGGNIFALRIQDSDGSSAMVFFSRIFNGWYVGTVVPYFSFYRDLYISALILATLGLVLSLALCYILLRFSSAKMLADKDSKTKSNFLATMSHEIRTPLNAIIGLSEIEMQSPDFMAERNLSSRENITQINRSGTALLGIINDILDISKIEAGRFELSPGVYSVASMINDAAILSRVRIGSLPIDFILEIDGNFPGELFGDEVCVKQILHNLLSNAIKYTKQGTVTLRVSYELIQSLTVLVRFSVQDTGRGIRAEDIDKLFTSYTQLDTGTNRKIEGTGLGLSIVKSLTEMMGGGITVKSEYGKGSCFTAEIIQEIVDIQPIGNETAENLKNFRYADENEKENINYSWLPEAKALIVDDVPANLQVAKGLLAPYGIQVDTAASGKDAIERLQRHTYHIIFMDHMMPEMDGVEAAAAIRAWEKAGVSEGNSKLSPEPPKRVPVIAMTANALHGMREFYLEHGFDDYLSKPINSFLLDEILKKWIPKSLFSTPQSSIPIPLVFLPLVEEQRLDILNHYRETFVSGSSSSGLAIDSAYFRKFTAFIKSCAIEDAYLQKQAAILTEAGQREDLPRIREVLPDFCKKLQNRVTLQKQESGNEQEILGALLPRLEKALADNELKTAEEVMKEFSAANLTDSGRELYFRLNDLMYEGDTEKMLELIRGEKP